MSLDLNSLLNEYNVFSVHKRFFWHRIDAPLRLLSISEKYLDLVKVVFGLHLMDIEFAEEKIKELSIETHFLKDFESIASILQKIFYYLTNNRIKINFKPKKKRTMYFGKLAPIINKKFVLFSGGLDSLCGSIHIAKKSNPILIHIITNQVVYNKVIKLSNSIPLRRAKLFCFDARTKSTKGGISETRGLFFCTIAFAIAASYSANSIVFCENGSQMLDVMLSPLAYPNKPATKNTNPIYLELFEELFTNFNRSTFRIEKIFRNKTRAEVILDYRDEIKFEDTFSCFSTRGRSGMCGICYNCFIRRMSLEALSIQEKKETYLYDPFVQIETDSPTYFERQRILLQVLRFYFGVLKKDPNIFKEINLSARNFFSDPIALATRFAQDIFLGVKNHISHLKDSDQNALGMKANELLIKIEERFA